MPTSSGAESVGKKALEELEKLISDHWGSLSAATQLALGVRSADRFILRIHWNLHRMADQPVIHIQRRTVAERFKQTGLPHLRPGGPAAQREARGLTRSHLALVARALDSRKLALSYGKHAFSLRQLEALQRNAAGLHNDVERLQTTWLGVSMASSPKVHKWIQDLSRGLDWYSRRFLPSMIREARQISDRDQRDSRRIVVSLVTEVETVIGGKQLERWSRILTWRVPRISWTPRLLRRWIREASASQKQPLST
jgi:hypothetical protein